uniref:Zgc:152968 n=1 Tax=Sinocyclocheilus anshuiensis TaxID=1608454 RepID=A0A671KVB3_9TELE
ASHLDLGDPEDNYTCLEELERINKEIEAVKSEVEKKQKRLSWYQTSQSLARTDSSGLCSEKYLRTTKAKDLNGNHLIYKKPVSTTSGLKYVVDRARPKTDLEYDPCSNFSADLLSSTGVKLKSTDKADTEHSLKNNRTGKNFQPLSSHFDDSDDEGTLVPDIPPSAKDQGKCSTKQKGKSIPHLPEGNCAGNNYHLANDQTKPRQHKEKLSSDGFLSHEIKNSVCDQEKERTSAKPVMIPQEQESSEGERAIDVSPLEDEHKLSKQCGTATKDLPRLCPISNAPAEDGKEPNKGPLNKPVMMAKHPVEKNRPFLEDLTEEPLAEPVNSINLNMEFVTQKEEKVHDMENVLDDISTCLDNLRSESERNKCNQDVKMLPVMTCFTAAGDLTLYEQLKEHALSEDMLRVNNFPRKHKDKADFAIQYGDTKKGVSDPLKRICCRCGATFSVDKNGKHTRREECNYHYGKVIENRAPGGVEMRYSCCENAVGSPGYQVLPQSSVPKTCPGVFALDTQTCYTTQGLELARVTVVNSSLEVVFDSFVKSDNDVVDYNTGGGDGDVKGTKSSLRDVQAVLLSFINADTILIGHGLENDLTIIHSTVIDTSVVFPHCLGLPHKREFNSLTADYLRRIIKESGMEIGFPPRLANTKQLMLVSQKENTNTYT